MLCRKCGKFVDDGANFCLRCGQPMTILSTMPPSNTEDPDFEIILYDEPVDEVTENTEHPLPQEAECAGESVEATEETCEESTDEPTEETEVICEEPAEACTKPEEAPKKKYKRWPSILVLALIFTFGFVVFLLTKSDSTIIRDDAMPWFTLQDGVLYFDEMRYTGGNQLTVPETINGQPVTAISDECFAECDELIMIYLPETVTTIGEKAFFNCKSLRGIRLPESLVSLGDCAFANCYSLESVCIPYSVKNFGEKLFRNCRNLKYFFYPAPVSYWRELPIEDIPADSFVYCADGIYPAK